MNHFLPEESTLLTVAGKIVIRRITIGLALVFLLGSMLISDTLAFWKEGSQKPLARASIPIPPAQPNSPIPVYLPFTWKLFPWNSPFGVESGSTISANSLLIDRASGIPTRWMRMNLRVSWRRMQPNEGDPLQWDVLASFENELRTLNHFGIRPIVIVNDYPAWATAERGGEPSYCGPMRADKFTAFAAFVNQLVNRYKVHEFNLHIWELGNEPDVDGSVYNLAPDNEFGCWGDWTDEDYYGGQLYGEMLKVVAPVIRAADPTAQVWIGGLLLDRPFTDNPGEGHPEAFLRGILQAGVGTDYSYFDVVPYHAYMMFNGQNIDFDNAFVNSPWYSPPWDGMIRGKARYLRGILNAYGVQKPLFADEIALVCPEYNGTKCNPPVDAFYEAQANHLVRVQVRGLDEGVSGFTWYTLDGPGWRNGGLLDQNGAPRPSYVAERQLAQLLLNATYLAPVDYGNDFEAYAFRRADQEIHVVWSKSDMPYLSIQVAQEKLIEARTRDGTPIAPVWVDGYFLIPVGFSPVYVITRP